MADPNASISQNDALAGLAKANGELDSLARELEHAHRLATLGTMAAGIAHEINNILTPVLAYAQLAANNPADNALQAKALERTIVGVQTVSQITQAMLGFSGTCDEEECANIGDVLHQALDCIGRDPAKDRIVVDSSIQPNNWIRMRPLALQQVFVNLILNACSAMHRLGGTLSISSVATRNGTTLIRVADDGPGIPDEVACRLFQPFVSSRKHDSDSHVHAGENKREGSGLGLAICKRLIEGAGGKIEAESRPGEGTVFTITVPTGQFARAKAG